jgi:hypothetical protein
MARTRKPADLSDITLMEPVPLACAPIAANLQDSEEKATSPAKDNASEKTLVPAIAGLHSRTDAGLRAPVRQPQRLPRREGLVVHCTDGHRPASPADVPRILRAVQAYHQSAPRMVNGRNVGGRGWSDAGYHWAVDEWGHVWQLRGWGVIGAHAKTAGHNLDSHGIVLLGDGREMTDRERAALLWVIQDAERRFGPQWVRGHGDIPGVSKACPGEAVMAFVRGLARG